MRSTVRRRMHNGERDEGESGVAGLSKKLGWTGNLERRTTMRSNFAPSSSPGEPLSSKATPFMRSGPSLRRAAAALYKSTEP